MNLWSILMTTDFTSDKPKIAQNNVLKLSSTLQGREDENKVKNHQGIHEKIYDSFLKGCGRCSRCKGVVVLRSQVIGVQVEHSNHESHKHCYENHHEFKDVLHSSS